MITGLFLGSFNPIHIGHLAIANYMLAYTGIEQLWFVVSPHNPLKNKQSLLADHHRLQLVRLAVEDYPMYRACDVEFKMPQPSYTIDTLTHLSDKYPQRRFVVIMGSDGLETFHKWKNYREIIANYHRYIYPRPNTPAHLLTNIENGTLVNAPQMDISSTMIRNAIAQGKDMPFFLSQKVYQYITEMHFYKK